MICKRMIFSKFFFFNNKLSLWLCEPKYVVWIIYEWNSKKELAYPRGVGKIQRNNKKHTHTVISIKNKF